MCNTSANTLHTARLEALNSLNFLDARAEYTASDDCLRAMAHHLEILHEDGRGCLEPAIAACLIGRAALC